MHATTMQDLMLRLSTACDHLSALGIFTSVDLDLDVAPGFSAEDQIIPVAVRVQVKEKPRLFIKTGTEVGADEGSVNAKVVYRNVFGAGEVLEGSCARGTRTVGAFQVQVSKPVGADHKSIVSLSASQWEQDWTKQSSYVQVLRDLSVKWQLYTGAGIHQLAANIGWRELGGLANESSLNIRELAGHSFKFGLAHTFTRDSRNDMFIPSSGSLLKWFNEVSSIDSIPVSKSEFETQLCMPLTKNSSLSLTGRLGLIGGLGAEPFTVPIHDRFFLGGPWTIRGFKNRGIGPRALQQSSFNNDSLGGTSYWACGVSLLAPVPMFKRYTFFKSHLFLNAGGLYDSVGAFKNIHNLPFAVSTGIGLAVQTSFCRLETNFTVPVACVGSRDILSPRFQIGFGMNFL